VGIASRRWTARVSMMGWDDELTIEQFVGCVSGLCLSWCGAVSAVSGFSQGWRLETRESGAIFEAIIGGEVLLYFAQALRDGTRK
jgi:uncharacterized membrane protein YeaQ/YmgE (transglycosylase-associated protein family)